MAYPRFQRARDFKVVSRTAGDITTLTSTTWADLPTIGTTWDLVLPADAGDVVEVGLSARKVYVSGTSVFLALDVATIVSGSPVNYVGATGGASDYGIQAWMGTTSAITHSVGGSALRVLEAGDISSGTVTLRLRYRLDAAGSYSLKAATTQPLQFWAKNLGPQDPN